MVVRTRRCCSVTPTSGWRCGAGHVHHRASRAWLDAINAPESSVFALATVAPLAVDESDEIVLGAYGGPTTDNREA